MDDHKLGLGILAIVSVLVLAGMVTLYRDAATLAVYEQPSNNKPVFIKSSSYLGGFDFCAQYLCAYPNEEIFYAENEPARKIGVDALTGNLRCGCPDGNEFQIRPDRIEVATY